MTKIALPRLVRFSSALRQLGVTSSTAKRLVRDPGALPTVFLGGTRYVREDDLRAYLGLSLQQPDYLA